MYHRHVFFGSHHSTSSSYTRNRSYHQQQLQQSGPLERSKRRQELQQYDGSSSKQTRRILVHHSRCGQLYQDTSEEISDSMLSSKYSILVALSFFWSTGSTRCEEKDVIILFHVNLYSTDTVQYSIALFNEMYTQTEGVRPLYTFMVDDENRTIHRSLERTIHRKPQDTLDFLTRKQVSPQVDTSGEERRCREEALQHSLMVQVLEHVLVSGQLNRP